MSVSVSVVLVLKKENEDVNFLLWTAVPASLAAFHETVSLQIKTALLPGCSFVLKYKKKDSHLTFELCEDEDVKTVLSDPSSFEILAFPTKISENISLQHKQDLVSSPNIHFDCNTPQIHQIDVSYEKEGETFYSRVQLSPMQISDTSHFIAALEDFIGFEVSKVYYINSAANKRYFLNKSSNVHNLIHQYFDFTAERETKTTNPTQTNNNNFTNYSALANLNESKSSLLKPGCRLPVPASNLFLKDWLCNLGKLHHESFLSLSISQLASHRMFCDGEIAKNLVRILSAHMSHTFLSFDCLVEGEGWTDGFLTALNNCRIVIILCSEKALEHTMKAHQESDDMLLEWEIAMELRKENQIEVIPYFVDSVLTVEIDGKSETVSKPLNMFDWNQYPDEYHAHSLSPKKMTIRQLLNELFRIQAGQINPLNKINL
ncbi:hypothetical protein HK096_003777, partial [Nowakowskiella sp. JEL0078]